MEPITVAAAGASNPTVAVGDGSAFVAWVSTEGGESNVRLARLDGAPGRSAGAGETSGASGAPGGTGSSAAGAPEPGASAPRSVRVNDIPGDAAPHGQAPARVALGPEGHVYVAWQNSMPVEGRPYPASDLRFARSTDGGRSFEPAIFVNDDAGGPPASHTFHDMAVMQDGAIVVSWIDGRNPAAGSEIRIARSTDGGRSFGSSVVVDGEACPCCRTALAVGPDGEVYVAWRKIFDGNVRDIVVARSADGGRSFGAPERVHEDGWVIDGCPHVGPAVAVDPSGRLHVVWFTAGEARHGLFHSISSNDGTSFAPPTRLSPEGPVPTIQATAAPGADGAIWIAWEDPRGDLPIIQLARSSEGGPPRTVANGAVPGLLPSLAAGDGTVAVAWLNGEAVELSRTRDEKP